MPKENIKYIVDIVPLTKIPLTKNQFFCYLSDEKLPVGTLVSIPLFRRKVKGVVIGARDDFKRLGNIELKNIEKIIEKEFLDEKQIKLAQYISDYYISPLGVVMKGFVPKRVKSRKYKAESIRHEKKEIELTFEQQKAVNQVTSYKLPACRRGRQVTSYLLFGPSGSGKTEIYIHSILELRKKDKNLQFLVLLPEKTLTPQALERYGACFKPEEIVVLSSNVSKGQYYANWQKIRSGEAKIIIGTRMAVFAPFKKVGLIIVDEEQDISFKQWDMNPRYDARKVAEKLAEIHKCLIVFGSATPSVETYHRAVNKKIKLIELPKLSLEEERIKKKEVSNNKKLNSSFLLHTSFDIVDMRLERMNKNINCISKKLKSEIAYALKNNLQTILFINRQGMSNFSVCEACKTVLKCPKCDRALVYDNSGKYRCVHCSHITSIIPACSQCKGIIFKNVGLGTQKVEREITNLFPNAKVARIDSQSAKKPGFQEAVYRKFSAGEIDILIGTQMIGKGWDLPNLALIGIIDADNMLSIPDFSSSTRFFQNIVQVAGRTNRPGAKFPGVVILQTFQPENKLMRLAAERNWEKFFELEMAERKALKLPPFVKLIKLIFQEYNFRKVEAETDRVYRLLEKVRNIEISEVQDAYLLKIRGRFRRQIVIKFKSSIPSGVLKILKQLPSGWIVDVDPISII